MQKYQHADLLTIVVECGYYDRTHLAKDFKLLTGETPTGFRKKSIFYVRDEDNSCNFADY